jgi:hypothetical protein
VIVLCVPAGQSGKEHDVSLDEHPEDLIDRLAYGGLAPEEQNTLAGHLERCVVCAAQLSLAQLFERQIAPRPLDELTSERSAEAAIRRLRRSSPARRQRVQLR